MGAEKSSLRQEEVESILQYSQYNTNKLTEVWDIFQKSMKENSSNVYKKNTEFRRTSDAKQTEEEDYINFEEFTVFLQMYFNIEGHEDLCRKLFVAFDKDSNGLITFKELAVSSAILEVGTPEEKLKFLFECYDENSKGCLDQEDLSKIVTQMSSVASALGRGVEDFELIMMTMLQDLDHDSDGKVSLSEWISGGTKNIPLLVMLGIDQSGYNTQKIREKAHLFFQKDFLYDTYCNACYRQCTKALHCAVCHYIVHEQCALKAELAICRPSSSFGAEEGDSKEPKHHWIEANFAKGPCLHCSKGVSGGLGDYQCSWCMGKAHSVCVKSLNTCELGVHRQLIIPPSGFRPARIVRTSFTCSPSDSAFTYDSLRNALEIVSEPSTTPLIVFINPKSGGNQGIKIHRKMCHYLNPRQVFNITQGGPKVGLLQFKDVENLRVLACGGDGTVGWVLSVMDSIPYSDGKIPPVSVLPLGTGNDLARVLNWGGGYTGESLNNLLLLQKEAQIVRLDRWKLVLEPNPDVSNFDAGEKQPLSIVNNYFSIGVDASIAHKFHTMREKYPAKFNSRIKNKLWYGQLGLNDAIKHKYKNLHKSIILECDGVDMELAERSSLQGIAVLNIPSMYGGTNLWADGGSKFSSGAMDDKKVEVVGLFSSVHVGQMKSGVRSAHRIAQCSEIKITTMKIFPMQIDGEPWLQEPCVISFKHHNQMPMLCRNKKSSKAAADSSK